jgi:hypothetical protein
MMTILLYIVLGILSTLMITGLGVLLYLFFTEVFALSFEETFYSEINEDYVTIYVSYTIPEAIEAKRDGSKLKLTGLI